jgi:hypothetical protein
MTLIYINRVFLTDPTGVTVYDSRDLPTTNPEGIAINNNATKPMMYVNTDPSAPSGPQYLPLLFGFYKPINGTGYSHYGKGHLPDYVTNPPPCDGCKEVYNQAVEHSFQQAEYWISHFPEVSSMNLALWISLPIAAGTICCVACMGIGVIAGMLIAFRVRKRKYQRTSTEPDLILEELSRPDETELSLANIVDFE